VSGVGPTGPLVGSGVFQTMDLCFRIW